MKKLKRFLFVFILMVSTMVVTACGGGKGNELLTTLESKQPNGIISEIKYYGKGDIAYKQTARNEVPYDAVGGKEKAKELLDPVIEKYKGLKGVNHKIEYGDKSLVEDLEIDYTAVDVKELNNIPGIMFGGGDPKNGVSVSKSSELLKKQGYVEKK